ncbi:hypothetical protein LTR67_010999 [Exophiala xenobiotica]
MSQVTAEAVSMADAEKNATSPLSAPTLAPKLRSCVLCRSRKVRCDKQAPCSNCRRANIACIFPSTDRAPRWARRFERLANSSAASNVPAPQDADQGVDKVMDRLRSLENLVKDLKVQLQQARAASSSVGDASSGGNSPRSSSQNPDAGHPNDSPSAVDVGSAQRQFGRMVIQDASHSRYVSSGFWSRVADELDGLEMDARNLAGERSDTSEDEESPGKTSSTQEPERTPSERHAFLFRHNLSPSAPSILEFRPLPSQVPFLFDVFLENVNFFIRLVHIPSITKIARESRGSGMTRFSPSHEALMFSIYYAAIVSMEEDDVLINFGSSKTDLSLKYRVGLEHALAKADFLNAPSLVLVQAFTIFLLLARRHDSPRFVWMMTGLVIRMAQYLGLQRDGTHFEDMNPFDVEIRRRVWWSVCLLDTRASEDQGTDLVITHGSFDTKIALNINDVDIDPESKQSPKERYGVTDMTFGRISATISDVTRQMMALTARGGIAALEDQSRLVNEIYQKLEQEYLQFTTEPGNIAYWVAVTIARLVMAKLTLIVFFPVLFTSPNEHISDEIRNKLFLSAIELAEYNHALNAEEACRQWRWIYQTHTHWHAIVYLMIEVSRRSWSPTVERAWAALHSPWLIPAQTATDKNLRIWVPLRRLMDKARTHRDAELERLRSDPQEAARVEMEDRKIPLPSSSGTFPRGSSIDGFRARWLQALAGSGEPGVGTQMSQTSTEEYIDASMRTAYRDQLTAQSDPANVAGDPSFNMSFEQTPFGTTAPRANQVLESSNLRGAPSAITVEAPRDWTLGRHDEQIYDFLPTATTDLSDPSAMGAGLFPWLRPDADLSADVFANLNVESMNDNMEWDGEMNWYNWVENAKGVELDARHEGNGRM